MNKVQEEAIEKLSSFKTIEILYSNTFAMHIEQLKTLQGDIETVLSMLQEQQEENKKKDKIIDLMAEYIASLDIEEDICVKTGKDLSECDSMALGGCENCIKQYFENKAEKE